LIKAPQIFGAHLNYTFLRGFLMTKNKIMAFLIFTMVSAVATSEASAAGDAESEWRIYSQEPNGDIYFFDASRVETITNLRRVWSRTRYKTSIMGASSYQSLLKIDCDERTERILQNTFFSDKQWKKPAMSTDKTEKPKRLISKDSASERLSAILCDQ